MGAPWEDYKAPAAGPWSDYGTMKDSPNSPRQAADSGEALLTNLPTNGIKQDLVRGLPAMGGGLAGALGGVGLGQGLGAAAGFALGGPPGAVVGYGLGGIAGGIAGAGIGAGTGEAIRQAVSQGTAKAFPEANYPVATGMDMAKNIGVQAAMGAAGEAGGQAIGAGLSAARPGLNRLGAGLTKVFANVPESSGAAAMARPGIIAGAPSNEAVSGLYDAFHGASGTVSRKESIAASADPFDTVSRAMETMRDASNKLKSGALTLQEAVNASQAGRIIRDMKSRGVEMAQQVAEQAQNLKGSFDNFIESGMAPQSRLITDPLTGGSSAIPTAGTPGFPEWQAARQGAFENNVAQDFGSAFPQNVNGSPNVGRLWGAMTSGAATGATAGGVMAGPVGAGIGGLGGAAFGAASVSPLTYGTMLKGAALVGKVPNVVYRVGAKAATAAEGSSLQDEYLRRSMSQPDPAFQSIGGMRPVTP